MQRSFALGLRRFVAGFVERFDFCIGFALGGSACGYLGRRFLTWLQIEEAWLRIPLYFVLITLLWPFCVLLVSIPLGQFQFFKNYLARLLNRFTNHNKL